MALEALENEQRWYFCNLYYKEDLFDLFYVRIMVEIDKFRAAKYKDKQIAYHGEYAELYIQEEKSLRYGIFKQCVDFNSLKEFEDIELYKSTRGTDETFIIFEDILVRLCVKDDPRLYDLFDDSEDIESFEDYNITDFENSYESKPTDRYLAHYRNTGIYSSILNGSLCPYCNWVINNSFLRETETGFTRCYCPRCRASVSVSEDGPMGCLADRRLSFVRQATHFAFDNLWKSSSMDRTRAYLYLAQQLKISPKLAHIAKFDVDTCVKAIYVCIDFFKSINDNTSADYVEGILTDVYCYLTYLSYDGHKYVYKKTGKPAHLWIMDLIKDQRNELEDLSFFLDDD